MSAQSALRGPALSSINLSANKCYGALITRSRIPCLDGRELGFPRLVSCTGAPAMSLKEICCGGQCIGRDVQISGAVVQDVLGQELCLADFTVHRAPRACREYAAIDQRQRCVKLVSKIRRPTTIVGESSHGRQSVLIAALASEGRLHTPNGQ